MTNIGIVGLGIMGLPMARNLLAAGHGVTGYARNETALARLVEAGGTAANSVAEAVASAKIFITMVPDSPQVEEIAYSEGGLLDSASPGLLYVDMSSIRPDVAAEVARRCREHGIRPLDAPVSGGEKGAVEATLSIMAGGEKADFDEALPVLSAMGKTIVHLGPSGSGQTVKAANQLIVGGTYELIAEAIVFLEAYGVDTEAALQVLGGGHAGSRIMEIMAPRCCGASSPPGSGSTCTTRTWAS